MILHLEVLVLKTLLSRNTPAKYAPNACLFELSFVMGCQLLPYVVTEKGSPFFYA